MLLCGGRAEVPENENSIEQKFPGGKFSVWIETLSWRYASSDNVTSLQL